MRPWLAALAAGCAVMQRPLAQDRSDTSNALDGDPRWCIHALAASAWKAGALACGKTLARKEALVSLLTITPYASF